VTLFVELNFTLPSETAFATVFGSTFWALTRSESQTVSASRKDNPKIEFLLTRHFIFPTSRVLFATDLHGSTLVFHKVLSAASEFEVDVVLIGGDLSGKRLIRIRPEADDSYSIFEPLKQKDNTGKNVSEAPTETRIIKADLDFFLQKLEAKGYYWHISDDAELARLNENTEELRELWNAKIYDRLCKWAQLVSEKLAPELDCYWTGGNDDDEEVLNKIASTDLGMFKYAEHKVIVLEGGFQLISLGFSNQTPFQTSRELTEEELLKRLTQLTNEATTADKLILNVHVPPKDCGHLDECLDGEDPAKVLHVGSVAVRTLIENIQPLADFSGHVHEGTGFAKIGRTYVFNPGSTYNSGVLQAFVVTFSGSNVTDYIHVSR
jgi:uncharacterized protein